MKEVSKFCQYFKIYKQNKFHAQLSWAWKKFYNLGADKWQINIKYLYFFNKSLLGLKLNFNYKLNYMCIFTTIPFIKV